MPKKIVLASITIVRDGRRQIVKPARPGQPAVAFDFTADEIKEIEEQQDKAHPLIRNPVNETKGGEETQDADVTDAGKNGGDETTSKTGGKTASKTASKTAARGRATANDEL